MAGAFINGPITPPNLRVEQIFQLRDPLVPDSGLPVVVIGLNRQVVFEESIGAYEGSLVALAVPSLTLYSATLVELDPIAYQDSDTGEAGVTASFPHVVFRHPQFGDATIPKKDVGAGISGWTFSQLTGAFTLDAGITFNYTILSGLGDLSARIVSAVGAVDANAGRRTFTAVGADFIGAGAAAGDILRINESDFSIIQVVNETELIVQDLDEGFLPAATDLDDASFSIIKTVGDGGSVYVSYVANRADRANQLIVVEDDTVEELFGPESILDPLGFYVRAALRNTNTTVLALQVGSDDAAGHGDAIDVLSTTEVPYDLVPLTQDEDILNDYIQHVNLMSTVDKAKERRVITNFQLVLSELKAQSGAAFLDFGVGGGFSNYAAAGTVVVRVNPGQNNLHILGVKQGDIFRDKTAGFEGEARIVSITPASPAVDADVTLALATPNTAKLFGTQTTHTMNLPATAQQYAVRIDAATFDAAETFLLNIDGVSTTFTAVVGAPATPLEITELSAANMVAQLQAYYGSRLRVTNPAGTLVEIRDVYGAIPLARRIGIRSVATVTWETVSGGAFVPNVMAGPDTAMVADDVTAGIKDGDTFSVVDHNNVANTFTFKGDQTTPNGSELAALDYAVQIGGVVIDWSTGAILFSATDVRDRVISAINLFSTNGLELLASAASVTPNVLITSYRAGTGAGLFLAAIIQAVTAPVTIGAFVAGTGVALAASDGSPITDWEVTTKTLTVDEQATYVAQIARDLNNRRVMNVWPDQCTERFEDVSAGDQLQQQGFGIFEGRTVLVASQPNYGCGAGLMAQRATLLAADPLTKRPFIGPYDLIRIDDYFTQDQLDRILSTGTMLMEQLQGAGGTVQVVRGVTTRTDDLKVAEENVGAAVDKFTRLVRATTKPIFGPNVIDPDGNFFELFSTKVQSVINRMTRRETREARDIQIVRVYENPDRKDSVIMEVIFTPLFGANDGLVQIFI